VLDAALGYLARGWSVIPGHWIGDDGLCSCRQLGPSCSPGKHPCVGKWLPFSERLPTENEVRYWWKRWPRANVCIVTGAVSNLVAVDVDPRHGGEEAWAAWCVDEPMPETPVSLTGGGGRHLLFAHPGVAVPSGANLLSPGWEIDEATGKRRKIQSGVDFRGDPGYIVAPPSTHESGSTYQWDTSAHPDDVPLPPMPTALIRLVLHQQEGAAEEARASVDVDGLMFGNTVLQKGERDVELARVAGSLVRNIPDEAALLSIMCAINERSCRPPLADKQVKKIAHSIYAREQTQQQARDADDAEINVLPADLDPLATAVVIWQALGVAGCWDWQILLGDRIEYVLSTPTTEIRIEDLLDYDSLRRLLLNHLGALPAPLKRYQFDRRAQLLRQCAREVMVEPIVALDRVQEWVDSYTAKFAPRADVPEEQQEEAIRQGPLVVKGSLVVHVMRLGQHIEAQFGEQMRPAELRRLLRLARWDPVLRLRAYKKEIRA